MAFPGASDPTPVRAERSALDVLILRDPREARAKCSLTPLRGLGGVRFVDHRPDRRVAAGERILLHTEGEELAASEPQRGLLLIDCAWRRVESLRRAVDGSLVPRRISGWVSAYPRRSKTHVDPELGLSSVEALFAALAILGDARPELLTHYRWRDSFLEQNRARLEQLGLTPS